MSDKSSKSSTSLGTTLLFAAIGGINGWIITNTAMGFVLGVCLGIIVEVTCLVGILPILGVVLYHFFVNALFDYLGMNLGLLYWVGMITTAIITVISGVYLLAALIK
jgi:hypothetical protein